MNGIPASGLFTAEQFAKFFGVSAATVRRWLTDYNIPHKMPGKTIIIDAEIFWRHIPQVENASTDQ